MVLNKRTWRITITNFCLGKHLVSENDLLKDQRGSPAYISPDVLSGKPYLGKPSDMWALGVVLFTMLYGQFPFYDSVPQELFRKIKAAEFNIPKDGRVSETTTSLINRLLVLDPDVRLTASQVLDCLSCTLSMWQAMSSSNSQLQVVPDIEEQRMAEEKAKKDMEMKHLQASELDLKLRQVNDASAKNSNDRKAICTTHRRLSQPPIRRLSQDARPLTSSEILAHRHLLT